MKHKNTLVVLGCVLSLISSSALADTALDRAKSFLNPNGLTILVPEVHFGAATGVASNTLVVEEPLALEAFRQAITEDSTLTSSTDSQVQRLLNLRDAWGVAFPNTNFRKILRALGAHAITVSQANQGTSIEQALGIVINGNQGGYRDVIMISEAGFNATQVAQFAGGLSLPGGCWNCNYKDSCWFSTCCGFGNSGCCVEIVCPPGEPLGDLVLLFTL